MVVYCVYWLVVAAANVITMDRPRRESPKEIEAGRKRKMIHDEEQRARAKHHCQEAFDPPHLEKVPVDTYTGKSFP